VIGGFLLGLISSVSFGLSDSLLIFSARRIGTIRTAAGSLLVSLAGVALYALVVELEWPSDPALILGISALGVLHGISYFAFVQALRVGPVSVVAPVTATSGAVTVLMAVWLLGEQPAVLQWLGVALTAAGAVLAATGLAATPGRARVMSRGMFFSVVTVFSYSAYTVALPAAILAAGWVQTVVISRGLSTIIALVVLLLTVRGGTPRVPAEPLPPRADDAAARPGSWHRARRWTLLAIAAPAMLLVVLGGLNAVGQLTRALALDMAPAWLVGIVVSTSPAAVLATGLLILHERVRGPQWVGICLIVAGLALVLTG
jgi:drug/metabolite transporter (DMT)-like permease